MTLPMIGQMGSYTRPSADEGDPLDLYVHGYVSSRIINMSRAHISTSPIQEEKGLPVTVSASHVDGLVLTLTPYSHNYNYRSALLFGYATVVSDISEKLYAMEIITNSVVPDRWANTRVPPTGVEMQSTSILKINISTGSAKIRTGPTIPGDEKKDDTDNAELVQKTWTGVIPVYPTLGHPLGGPFNVLENPPEYLDQYLQQSNDDAKDLAIQLSKKGAEKGP